MKIIRAYSQSGVEINLKAGTVLKPGTMVLKPDATYSTIEEHMHLSREATTWNGQTQASDRGDYYLEPVG